VNRVTKVITPALLLLSLQACAGNESGTSLRERCSGARQRVAEIRTAHLGTPTEDSPLATDLAKHRAAMVHSLGDAYVERCVARGPRFADCVTNADDASALASCQKATNKESSR